jgi:hypothetical protein
MAAPPGWSGLYLFGLIAMFFYLVLEDEIQKGKEKMFCIEVLSVCILYIIVYFVIFPLVE